jgi:Putative Flp pilus-assembly TadE/G-like
MRRWRGGREDGQATTAFVLIGLVVMILLVFKYMVPLSSASDHRGQGQTAAEASALAGAQSIAEHVIPDLIGAITTPGQLGDVLDRLTHQMGQADADDLARANSADLVDYDYSWSSGTVTATIRPQATENGTLRTVSATARVGFPWTECHFVGFPTPSPSTSTPPPSGPTATPTQSPTSPPPPPDQDVQLVCGPVSIDFTLVGRTGLLRVVPGQFDDLLHPRLVA